MIYLIPIIKRNNYLIKLNRRMRKYFFLKDFFSDKIANFDTLKLIK